MPLHLLGKKSWNVYNAANIERVRRDEAAAQAREEAEEQAMQEADARRRTALLRGDVSAQIDESLAARSGVEGEDGRGIHDRDMLDFQPRKRRRLRGEDETDREIRFAREDAAAAAAVQVARAGLLAAAADAAQRKRSEREEDGDVALLDERGHLVLFPQPVDQVEDGGNAARGRKGDRKDGRRRTTKDDAEGGETGLRLRDAVSDRHGSAVTPWYEKGHSSARARRSDPADAERPVREKAAVLADLVNRDVWGNEDPRREQRERTRLAASDPFAAMQVAQRQLKQSALDRERWKRERMQEVGGGTVPGKGRHCRRGERVSRGGAGSGIGIVDDGFRLDDDALPTGTGRDVVRGDESRKRGRDSSRRRSRHTDRDSHRTKRHRSRSGERGTYRHRHRNKR